MCPFCGELFNYCELTPYHPDPQAVHLICPGSKQYPRNPESDCRLLWSGEKNPYNWRDGEKNPNARR